MRKSSIIITLAALLLTTVTGCQKQNKATTDSSDSTAVSTAQSATEEPAEGASEYDCAEALSFGFVGDVKQVITRHYEATPSGDKLVRSSQQADSYNDSIITFNKKGQVTIDPYANPYVYDDEGKFVKGRSKASKVKINDEKLVVSYENRESNNHWEGYEYQFTYDESSRMKKVTYAGWEEVFSYSYTYDGDKRYPATMLMDGQACADLYKSTTKYRYTRFDDLGNWLEREAWTTEEQGVDSGEENPEMEITKKYTIEVREITYY